MWPWFCHPLVLSIHFSLLSRSFPSFLSFFSPHLFPLGVQAFCLFFFANLDPSQPRPNVHSQTPKIYESSLETARRPLSAGSTDCHVIRWCGNIGNYRLCSFASYISVFTLPELSEVAYACMCTRADAHTHTRFARPPPSLGVVGSCSHSWQENHKFLIQASAPNVSAERKPFY